MRPNVWEFKIIDGVEIIEHDGYHLELNDLRTKPDFFVKHISEKSWGTEEVVQDLRAWIYE